MPALILRIVVIAVLAYLAGATITPLLWGQVMVREAKETLSPFAMLSGGILLFGAGYSIKQIFHR